jgi:hypothetical protein
MANVTSGSPLKLDTAEASWTAMSLPNGLALDVRKIYWESPTTHADTVQITDADGLVLWEATAEADLGSAGNSQVFYFQSRELLLTKNQGWFLKQISSGTLWVYFATA